jgi:integrase
LNPKLLQRFESKQLEESTKQKYAEILDGAPTDQLIAWIRHKVDGYTPIGTVLPLRAAVKHYLVGVFGYNGDQVDLLLPDITGRPPVMRQPLTAVQLAKFHAAAEQVNSLVARTILLLLPATGLQIGEITALRVSDVRFDEAGAPHAFAFDKRGKQRVVPIPRGAARVLSEYLESVKPTEWLFITSSGNPITEAAIRCHTRSIAAKHSDLAGLSPQVLRATYAAMTLQSGKSLDELQVLMGHKSILTTQRYLRPS